jgi:hypothetical protein
VAESATGRAAREYGEYESIGRMRFAARVVQSTPEIEQNAEWNRRELLPGQHRVNSIALSATAQPTVGMKGAKVRLLWTSIDMWVCGPGLLDLRWLAHGSHSRKS